MCRRRKELISVLVPYKDDHSGRARVWGWLRQYIHWHLVGCEIVVGKDWLSDGWVRRFLCWFGLPPVPFSKTRAVNNAFRRSHGDVIVILDADAYLDMAVVEQCAKRLRTARRAGVRTWFMPYRWLYRLTPAATREVLASDPHYAPLVFPTPPPTIDVEGTQGSESGHTFGAMCQIMPWEAFVEVGGMDERFRGWGGEDKSFLLALDTLWGRHQNTANDILHLHHPKLLDSSGKWSTKLNVPWEKRMWVGQGQGEFDNGKLALRFSRAYRDVERMRYLVDEGRPVGVRSLWWRAWRRPR